MSADPHRPRVASLALGPLLGMSQIFFQRSLPAALLILGALLMGNAWLALGAAVGAAVQSGAALLMPGVARQDVADGKQAFSGALTGAAGFLALGPGTGALTWAVLGGLLCMPVTLLLDRVVLRRPSLPSMTAPFCLVASTFLLATHDLQPAPGPLPYTPHSTLPDSLTAVLTSLSEVEFVDHVVGALLILVALLLCGWRVAAWALAGAAVSSTVGGLLFQDAVRSVNGLDGYSGVLVAVGLGTVFLTGSHWRVPLALVGAAVTVPVELALRHLGLPIYTWPFVLVTWAALLLHRALPRGERPAPHPAG